MVGGGTAGWMAAAVLSRVTGLALDVELVESDAIGTVGVGEATIPQIRLLTALLGIDENDFLRNVSGTIKLGIEFNDWGRPGDSYMHAFGNIGRSLGMVVFHHYWLKASRAGNAGGLWDYSLNYQAACQNRFARLDRVGDSGLGGLEYAYHFDATLVAAYLRRLSEAGGVRRTEGRIVDTTLREPDGFIESVTLEDGRKITGDLFIDCSGFRGLLIEEALGAGYEDWRHWLPCDSAIAVPCAKTEPLKPYTRSTARAAGWQWRIPLQHRTGNGHVYCSEFMSDDEACAILLANLDGRPEAEPRQLRFTTGMRRRPWHRNCLSLGLASGFMEPLESTSIHLVQSGLSRLITLFPERSFSAADIEEYNRQTRFEYERIRDFLVLHYCANQRDDSDFWIGRRELNLPDSLQRKIELFRSSGRIFRDADELFAEVAWLQVMLGQGILPQSQHPLADLPSAERLKSFLEDLRQLVRQTASRLPAHAEFLREHCAAAD